jgi:hypothetical protein
MKNIRWTWKEFEKNTGFKSMSELKKYIKTKWIPKFVLKNLIEGKWIDLCKNFLEIHTENWKFDLYNHYIWWCVYYTFNNLKEILDYIKKFIDYNIKEAKKFISKYKNFKS